MSERTHARGSFDSQQLDCCKCQATEQADNDVELSLQYDMDGYNKVVCDECLPDGDV